MGITKTSEFSTEQNQMANVFKALGHPARVAIVEYLLKMNTCICGDIVNALPLAQATISQHLKELKHAEIIKGSIEGKSICYCLNEQIVSQLRTYFESIEINLKTNTCC
jgi:ArsR family transcriptional regulator, arsenate/arsenite/antimonite-responsive transcriptional repressor